ncbi:hypothetical protein VSDG_03258 [Cytospora chrysosperma]|uniref:Chromosome transmission fidelity protein 8 n=1 Tax=Cytospora chrysosperma TaxID=252740 RepID=A0A423WAX8_CYTCH|nr:hypothetical protein VSDG_03258 [Valsa sordida]
MATPSSNSVTLHLKPIISSSSPTAAPTTTTTTAPHPSPLPQLLQTPSGLALLELQGTFNTPPPDSDGDGPGGTVPIGRLDFPDYRPDSVAFDASSTAWMRRVYMYVGQHQRLTGEVKKLPRALGVVRRREAAAGEEEGGGDGDELEIVEIVRHKIVFSSRPEPVGTAGGVVMGA